MPLYIIIFIIVFVYNIKIAEWWFWIQVYSVNLFVPPQFDKNPFIYSAVSFLLWITVYFLGSVLIDSIYYIPIAGWFIARIIGHYICRRKFLILQIQHPMESDSLNKVEAIKSAKKLEKILRRAKRPYRGLL